MVYAILSLRCLVLNLMLKEPNTYVGIASLFSGIALLLKGDILNGTTAIATALIGILSVNHKKEILE